VVVSVPHNIPWRVFLLGALVYLCVHIALVGRADIGGSSEAREAHVISQVADHGEWILPRRNGIIPSKPPLFHWTGAVLSSLTGGVTELSVRAPSVLYGLLTILCTGLITFRIASSFDEPWRVVRPHHAALIASGVLSLTYGFHQMSCQAMVDMAYTFCVWGGLTALVWCDPDRWSSERRVSSGSIAVFWAFCAVGVLARGPLAPVLPLLIAGTVALVSLGVPRAVTAFLRPNVGWLFFLVPIGWYWLAYERGGDAFLERQLFFENLKRVTGGENINTEAWWFYFPSLLRTTFPWGTLVILVSFSECWGRRGVSHQRLPARVITLPLLCLATGITLLSIASGKRHSYLLPLMPLVAIAAALLFAQVRERKVSAWAARLRVVLSRTRHTAAALMLVMLIGAIVFVEGRWNVGALTDVIKGALLQLIFPIAVAGLVAFLAGYLLPRFDPIRLTFQCWAALFALMAVIVASGSTVKASFKSFRGMSEDLRAMSHSSTQLVVIKEWFDEYFDPILYYLKQPVRVQPADVKTFSCDEHEVYFTHRKWLDGLVVPESVSLTVLGTLRERRDSLMGEGKREVVVFRCDPRGPLPAQTLVRRPSPHVLLGGGNSRINDATKDNCLQARSCVLASRYSAQQ
jgi:4-amino-4-deoxy-L-arabinose transferase-like glycosyltransferase